jgi:hypothetical protein
MWLLRSVCLRPYGFIFSKSELGSLAFLVSCVSRSVIPRQNRAITFEFLRSSSFMHSNRKYTRLSLPNPLLIKIFRLDLNILNFMV